MKDNIFEKPMNITETSNFLGYKVYYLYKMIKDNKIPFHKPEGKVFFFKSELLEWIKRQK